MKKSIHNNSNVCKQYSTYSQSCFFHRFHILNWWAKLKSQGISEKLDEIQVQQHWLLQTTTTTTTTTTTAKTLYPITSTTTSLQPCFMYEPSSVSNQSGHRKWKVASRSQKDEWLWYKVCADNLAMMSLSILITENTIQTPRGTSQYVGLISLGCSG